MKKIQVYYIISNIDKAISFEWIANHLDKTKFSLKFILLNPSPNTELQKFFIRSDIEFKYIKLSRKKDYLNIIFKLIVELFKNKPDIVHCHLFDASILGIISAYLVQIKKRITTRHYSTLHHEYFPQAIKYDKIINLLATHIVSISDSTKKSLFELEGVQLEKIVDIPHGFDLNLFENVDSKRIDKIYSKYKLTHNKINIGVISRYTEWKGIQYIIDAFKMLKTKHTNVHLILANATGDFSKQIQLKLSEISPNSFTEIKFEYDQSALYKTFDIFIHVPINSDIEAFGQIYIESMAAGIPGIFTKSGIGNDICIDKENCLVVDYKNSEEIYQAMICYIENKALKDLISQNSKKSIASFNLNNFINKIENLYNL